jgi:hypothetical protein
MERKRDPEAADARRDRRRRRSDFLKELAEARELRKRVAPHRERRVRLRAALRRRTFRV